MQKMQRKRSHRQGLQSRKQPQPRAHFRPAPVGSRHRLPNGSFPHAPDAAAPNATGQHHARDPRLPAEQQPCCATAFKRLGRSQALKGSTTAPTAGPNTSSPEEPSCGQPRTYHQGNPAAHTSTQGQPAIDPTATGTHADKAPTTTTETWKSNPKTREHANQFLKNINIQFKKGATTTPQPNDNHSETDATLTTKTSDKNTHKHMQGQQTVPTNSTSPAPKVITNPAQPHSMMQSLAQQQHASTVTTPTRTEPQTGSLAPTAPSPEATPEKPATPPTKTNNLQPANDADKGEQTRRPNKRARKEKADKPYQTLPQIAETEDEHWASNDLSKAAIVKLTKKLNNPCSS